MNKILLVFLLYVIISGKVFSQCPSPTTSNCDNTVGGTSRFYMTTDGNVDFVFDNMNKYIQGITLSGETMLRLHINELNPGQCRWRLLMVLDNLSGNPGEWEELVSYGSAGSVPELELLQVKVYNGCGTPIYSGVFQNFSALTNYELDIIPWDGNTYPSGNCDGSPVNVPGSYLTNYNEYNFVIDYKIVPGFNWKPGAYNIKLHFCLVEVN